MLKRVDIYPATSWALGDSYAVGRGASIDRSGIVARGGIREMHFANLAAWDRTLRVLLGLAMLAAGWFLPIPEVGSVALKVFGWVPLLTGLLGWSPLYSLLQISTRRSPLRRR